MWLWSNMRWGLRENWWFKMNYNAPLKWRPHRWKGILSIFSCTEYILKEVIYSLSKCTSDFNPSCSSWETFDDKIVVSRSQHLHWAWVALILFLCLSWPARQLSLRAFVLQVCFYPFASFSRFLLHFSSAMGLSPSSALINRNKFQYSIKCLNDDELVLKPYLSDIDLRLILPYLLKSQCEGAFWLAYIRCLKARRLVGFEMEMAQGLSVSEDKFQLGLE